MDFYEWRPHVPVAQRRADARKELDRVQKKGRTLAPVRIEGRDIARTFWGRAWCANLERYSDYSNRLPRGRSYARNGAVLDLGVEPGAVRALVRGRRLYDVAVRVDALPPARWASIRADCSGGIDSLVGLLQGRFPKAVMERLCLPKTGLFPGPREIKLACSCPDWAGMCKHVAAALYGIGARLDEQPELLFRLRGVDEHGLIAAAAGGGLSAAQTGPAAEKILDADGLSELFGLDIHPEEPPARGVEPTAPAKAPRRPKADEPAPTGAAARKKGAPLSEAERTSRMLDWIVKKEVRTLMKAERVKLKARLEGLVQAEVKKALRRALR